MKAIVDQEFKTKTGKVFRPGDIFEAEDIRVINRLVEKGRVRLLPPSGAKTASPDAPSCPDQGSGQATLPEAGGDGLKTQYSGHSETATWDSPVFGLLSAPILSRDFETFTLIHPLTGEVVTLSNEWLVSMDERAAILEHDGGLPREEADQQAKIEFFGLFRKRGANEKRD